MKWALYVGDVHVADGETVGRESVSVKVWNMERTESGLEHETLGVEIRSPSTEPRVYLRESGVEP